MVPLFIFLSVTSHFVYPVIHNTVKFPFHFRTHVHQDNAEWNYTIEDSL